MTTNTTASIATADFVPGKVATHRNLRESIEEAGKNVKFDGTLEELEALVMEHFDNWIPGIGSQDGDVRIVQLPTAGFHTDIVEVTEENKHLITIGYEARYQGEEAVPVVTMATEKYPEASKVGIVIYRQDVLAQDDDRSSDAEWEIVAILADPCDDVPMHPVTMARNSAHAAGGTYREYSADEWLRATLFWQKHVKLAGTDKP